MSICISFEGIDGSGKSTQAKRLVEHLNSIGRTALFTREPGGTGAEGAEMIRSLLVTGDEDRWDAHEEILLFKAARLNHLRKTVRPALERGEIVVTDRFADSTRVYQGAGRANLRPLVDALHDLVIGFEPHLTIIIDMDAETALRRGKARKSGEDRFEDMGLDFQLRLREGYRSLADDFPERCIIIDGTGTEDEVFTRVLEVVESRLS